MPALELQGGTGIGRFQLNLPALFASVGRPPRKNSCLSVLQHVQSSTYPAATANCQSPKEAAGYAQEALDHLVLRPDCARMTHRSTSFWFLV
jgi:hypothetical protein